MSTGENSYIWQGIGLGTSAGLMAVAVMFAGRSCAPSPSEAAPMPVQSAYVGPCRDSVLALVALDSLREPMRCDPGAVATVDVKAGVAICECPGQDPWAVKP